MENKSLLNKGTQLFHGKYLIQRYLSSGGFGNTYEATDTSFNERVAIKELFVRGMCGRDEHNAVTTLDDNKQSFDSLLQKFKKEALRLRRIDHRNIVKVRDFFEENGTAYYVMDFVEGASLASVIKATGKPLAEDKALDIFNKVLSALECIHNNNIWHLDIKPGNIMIDKDFNPILIDFGASKQLKDAAGNAMSTSSSLVLTPGFAPAEQMEQNFDKFGPWTDFYALGATLYFCLTLRVPPMPSDIAENGAASLNMPKSISGKTQQLTTWLLEPNRSKRPQSVAEIKEWMKKAPAKPANDSLETVVAEKRRIQEKSSTANVKSPKKFSKKYLLLIPLLIVIAGSAIGFYLYQPKHWLSEADAYYYGEGRAVDKTKAAELYAKAVDRGNAEAMCKLGKLYTLENNGVKQDYKKAVELFQKAIDKGNSDAMNELAGLYKNGIYFKCSEKKAFNLYRCSAEKNNPLGQSNLGDCYKDGIGTLKDTIKADSLYNISFKTIYDESLKGNYYYWYNLAVCYVKGSGVPADSASAFKWFEKAAIKGDAAAQESLGYCYSAGVGCKCDENLAFKWSQQAAIQGCVDALNNLGVFYENGEGVKQNIKSAFNCYLKAATLGGYTAQYNTAKMYENGQGVTKDIRYAIYWYKKAADNGDEDAKEALERLDNGKDYQDLIHATTPINIKLYNIYHLLLDNNDTKAKSYDEFAKWMNSKNYRVKIYNLLKINGVKGIGGGYPEFCKLIGH